MTSIRRTLSPVPRPGTSLSGEACLVASPLSRSSQSPQNYPSSVGLLSSLFPSPEKRSKTKITAWRRSLFHFFTFFVFGMFIGFTPFASVNSSIMSHHHTSSFEMNSALENLQTYVNIARNTTPLKSNSEWNLPQPRKWGLIDLNSEYSLANDSITEIQKLLIIVTPTISSPFQGYYLNRLAQTLKLVSPPLVWIVVEMNSQSSETANRLGNTGVVYRHLVCNKNVSEIKDQKVHQRNTALAHIELHHLDGIVYFADEESIYSVDLFKEIRTIRRFGTWKVGKVIETQSGAMLEGPVCNGTQVVGWHLNRSNRKSSRRFHAELSGFAFNSTILWDPKRWHRPTAESIRLIDEVKEGFQVSNLIEQIVKDESQMEGLPLICSRIMVWDLLRLKPSNLNATHPLP